jgi:hypothetical protein
MIESVEIALLARLHSTGNCRESERIGSLIQRYQTAGWIIKGKRRHEWNLKEHAVEDVENRLTVLLPTWKSDFAFLIKQGKSPFKTADLEALSALRRPAPRKNYINRRNWCAISGAGPKHRQHRHSSDDLTVDWVLRLRPNQGLTAVLEDKEVDLYEIASLWTECVIPERAWANIKGFKGNLPKVIITCENLGAYIDIPDIPNAAIVYSPGKDIRSTVNLLDSLPSSGWIHFGDIDPEGVNIALQIAKKTKRPFSSFIPSFIEDYFDLSHRVRVSWKETRLTSQLSRNSEKVVPAFFRSDSYSTKDLRRNLQRESRISGREMIRTHDRSNQPSTKRDIYFLRGRGYGLRV